jgi:hypothetical protein
MQPKINTPEKSETRGFNDLQFRSSLTFIPRPRRRRKLSLFKIALGAAGVGALVYALTYFVLARVLG